MSLRSSTRAALVALALSWVAVSAVGCRRPTPPAERDDGDGRGSGAVDRLEGRPPSPDVARLAKAENRRIPSEVGDEALKAEDGRVRIGAARALARIAASDAAAVEERLLEALGDADLRVVAWAAYGLGQGCKGRDVPHVKALAARAATLIAEPSSDPHDRHAQADGGGGDGGQAEGVDGGAASVAFALARALGTCGGPLAEPTLAAWVRSGAAFAPAAALGLGDIAGRREELSDESVSVLLDAAEGGVDRAPLGEALYPFGRMGDLPEAFADRATVAAQRALERPGDTRIFAVRALGRARPTAAPALEKVVVSAGFTPAERAEAVRGLARMGSAGQSALAEALAFLTPDKDPVAIARFAGDDFGVFSTLVGAFRSPVIAGAKPALFGVATLDLPGATALPLARRLASLRCAAAAALAVDGYEDPLVERCAPPDSVPWERARLRTLVALPLGGARRAAWLALSRTKNAAVRDEVLESIGAHPELHDAARTALAEALEAATAGAVATAADVIFRHPERAFVLASKERRAGLDPRSPLPSPRPAQDLDPQVAKALAKALARTFAEDRVEARASLLDAAAAVRLPGADAAFAAACADANVTMRERAVRAMRAFGVAATSCPPPAPPPPAAPELDKGLSRPTRVTFASDAGRLSIVFDPALAPVAATRFVALARAGFFRSIHAHRVVPGFVVQFGDPEGDGYGGAGRLLRDEASPVPFGAFDVGVALAGRDTGSSQLFVTLARAPHLDGGYTRVGIASGDWAAVADGDVIGEAAVDGDP